MGRGEEVWEGVRRCGEGVARDGARKGGSMQQLPCQCHLATFPLVCRTSCSHGHTDSHTAAARLRPRYCSLTASNRMVGAE